MPLTEEEKKKLDERLKKVLEEESADKQFKQNLEQALSETSQQFLSTLKGGVKDISDIVTGVADIGVQPAITVAKGELPLLPKAGFQSVGRVLKSLFPEQANLPFEEESPDYADIAKAVGEAGIEGAKYVAEDPLKAIAENPVDTILAAAELPVAAAKVATLAKKLTPKITDVTGAVRQQLIPNLPDVALTRTSAGDTAMIPVSNEGMLPANIDIERLTRTRQKPMRDIFDIPDEPPPGPRSLSSAANLEPPLDEAGQYMLFPERAMASVAPENATIASIRKTLGDLVPTEDWKPTPEALSARIPVVERQLADAQRALVDAPDAASRKEIQNTIKEIYADLTNMRTQAEGQRFVSAEQLELPLRAPRVSEMRMTKKVSPVTVKDINDIQTKAIEIRKQIAAVLEAINKEPDNLALDVQLADLNRQYKSLVEEGTTKAEQFNKPSNIATSEKQKKLIDKVEELKSQIAQQETVIAKAKAAGQKAPSGSVKNLSMLERQLEIFQDKLTKSKPGLSVKEVKSEMRKKSTGESPGGALPMRFEDTPYKRGLIERDAAQREQDLHLSEISRKFGDTPDETNSEYRELVRKARKAGDSYSELTQKYPKAQDFEDSRAWIKEQMDSIKEDFKNKKSPFKNRLDELQADLATATIDRKSEIAQKIASINTQISLLDNAENVKLQPLTSENKQNSRKFIEAALKNPEMLEMANPDSPLMKQYNEYMQSRKTGKESVADFLESAGKGIDAFLNAPQFGPEAAAFEGKPSKLLQSVINKLRNKKGGGGTGGEGGSGGMPPGGTPPPQLPPAGGKSGAKTEMVKAPKASIPFYNIKDDNPEALAKELSKYFDKPKSITPVADVGGGISYETASEYRREGPARRIAANENIRKMELPNINKNLESEIVTYEKMIRDIQNEVAKIEAVTSSRDVYPEYIKLSKLRSKLNDKLLELNDEVAELKIQHIYQQRPDWRKLIPVKDASGNTIMMPKVSIVYEPESNLLTIKDNVDTFGPNTSKYYMTTRVDRFNGDMDQTIMVTQYLPDSTGKIPRSSMFRGGELMQYVMYFFRDEVKSISDLYVETNRDLFEEAFIKAIKERAPIEEALRRAAAGTWSGKQHLSRGFDIEGSKAFLKDINEPALGIESSPRARYDLRPRTKSSGGKK